MHGNTVPPDGCPRGRFTAPAGCAAESRMTILRSGISGRQWTPSSSCWKSSNFFHEKTLPSRDWQTPAAPGQEAFLTPYLTTVRTGTRGNSGFKSVKKYLIPSGKCRKALQITAKIWFKRLGAGGREFESHHSDHLHQKDRLFRRSFCVILSFLKTTLFTSYGLLLLLRPGT